MSFGADDSRVISETIRQQLRKDSSACSSWCCSRPSSSTSSRRRTCSSSSQYGRWWGFGRKACYQHSLFLFSSRLFFFSARLVFSSRTEFGRFIQVQFTTFIACTIWHFTSLFLEPMFWLNYCQNLLWLRNHVVAPLSEEFTFRACMLPLLLQSFSPMTAIFITPLFFGVGELIHCDWSWSCVDSFVCSTFASHDWTSSDGNGQEDGDLNIVLPILLHIDLWHLLSFPLCADGTLCGTVHRARLLQSHGIPRHSWSHFSSRAKALHFPHSLRPWSRRLDSFTANDD